MLFRFHQSLNSKTFGRRSLSKDATFKGLLEFYWNIGKRNMSDGRKANTRVLFCGPHFPASHNYTKEYLKNYPFIQVDDLPFDTIPDLIGKYDMCVVKSMRLTSDLIARATQMKLIMQYGVGLEGVDIAAATNLGIKVARIPSGETGNAASCAEMAIYFMLALLRKQNEMQIAVRQKKLGEPVGDTLLGKTVFIMGFGNIGIELAKRLRPFGVRILATKRSWPTYVPNTFSATEPISQNGTHEDLVDEKGSHEDIYKFAKISDIVVCCLTMNKETAGVINKKFISSMRKTTWGESSPWGCTQPNRYSRGISQTFSWLSKDVYPVEVLRAVLPNLGDGSNQLPFQLVFGGGGLLVNIARGGLLDYEAIHNGLKSGHLGGLGMDVAWTEPFDADDPVLKFPNVLLTPHVAGVTEHSYRSMAKVVGDVALQLHSGKPITGIEYVN